MWRKNWLNFDIFFPFWKSGTVKLEKNFFITNLNNQASDDESTCNLTLWIKCIKGSLKESNLTRYWSRTVPGTGTLSQISTTGITRKPWTCFVSCWKIPVQFWLTDTPNPKPYPESPSLNFRKYSKVAMETEWESISGCNYQYDTSIVIVSMLECGKRVTSCRFAEQTSLTAELLCRGSEALVGGQVTLLLHTEKRRRSIRSCAVQLSLINAVIIFADKQISQLGFGPWS